MNRLSRLSLIACFFAFMVIGLGAFTRLMDAGLGCPDWPLCYGQIVVPNAAFDKYKAWAEMIHRYFAGILSILIVAVIVCSFMRKTRNRNNVIFAIALLFLIFYQIILGQLTVTLKLMPIIVVGHLLGGFLILSVLWLIYLGSVIPASSSVIPAKTGMTIGASIGLFLLFLQIFLGAFTSTNYAALSCPDFPFCFNDHPFLTMDFKNAFHLFSNTNLNYEGGLLSDAARQTIHMTHRINAFILMVYLFVFTLYAWPKIKNIHGFVNIIYIIWGLFSLQLFLGIANVVFQLPVFAAVCHTLVAVLLLLSMITFLYYLLANKRKVI